jgi:hypothetical protein
VDFFDAFPPLPPPAPHQRQRRQPWHQPDHVLPASVPGEALVLRTPDAAVWIGALRAYPNGFSFALRALRRELADGRPRMGRPFPERYPHPDPFRAADRNTGLRLGIQYADGRRAAMGEGLGRLFDGPGPQDLWLMEGSGSGSELTWDAEFWVAPLPPAGPVTLVGVWPDAGATEQRAQLDGAAIRAAAARCVELWPEDEFLDDGPSTSVGTLVIDMPDEPGPPTE